MDIDQVIISDITDMILYPVNDNVFYGVLNARDEQILKNGGMPENKVQVLSNPVVLDGNFNTEDSNLPDEIKNLFLYPIRAIPRKNIGELVLWSVLANEGDHFAITLAPKNPKYKDFYSKWVSFCENHQLPVTFEPGKKWNMTFPELLSSAKAIITTSIQEGFGLVYLESWLLQKPLFGRLISDITKDFTEKGIEFPDLYTELLIPVEWIGEDRLRKELEVEIESLLERYSIEEDGLIKDWIDVLIQEGKIDFGSLSSELQRNVIEKIIENPELKKEVPEFKSPDISPEILQRNKVLVEKMYNLKNYGEKLYSIYQELIKSQKQDEYYLNSKKVLLEFLSPKQFSLLRA